MQCVLNLPCVLHLLNHLPLELILYTLELLPYEELCYFLHYSPYLREKLNGYIVPLCISRTYFDRMAPTSENLYQISFEHTSKIFPPSKSLLDYTYNMDLYYYITNILPQEMHDNPHVNDLQVYKFFDNPENLYTFENKLEFMVTLIIFNDLHKVLCVLRHFDSLECNVIETMTNIHNPTDILDIIQYSDIIIETICSIGNFEMADMLIEYLKNDCIDIEEDLSTIPYIAFLHKIYVEAKRLNQTDMIERLRIKYSHLN